MTTDSHPPRLDVRRDGDRTVVRFTNGSLNEYVADQVGRQLSDVAGQHADGHIVLDLGGVDYVTSTVLGHFVGLHKKLRAGGGRLTLENVPPAVAEVLRVTQLDQVLDHRPAG
jgi:anti-sigma B factor antagonist